MILKNMLLIAVIFAAGCASAGMKSYSGESFSIDYPAGWTVNSSPYHSVVFSDISGNASLSVANVSESIEDAVARTKTIQSYLRNHALIEERNTTVNGLRAYRRTYTWTDAAYTLDFTQTQVWVAGKQKWEIVATSANEDFEKNKPVFDQMIESFKEK